MRSTEHINTQKDPYWHLHDEAFETELTHPLLGADDGVFMGGREVQSLNGPWRFAIDPMQEGLRQRWYEHDELSIDDWTIPRDYDDGTWQTVPVPSCWTTERAEWLRYEGPAWYSREFETALPSEDERILLRVGAANERARVFLNGIFCGLHIGGSTPFFVDLTPHIRAGKNFVMIEVDSTRRADAVPMHHTDWFNHGGLYRDVELVRVPAICVTHLFVRLTDEGVAVSFTLSSECEGVAIVDIHGLGQGEIPVHAGKGAAVFDWSPELWSPENPRLYELSVTVGNDKVGDKVGFRQIKRRGKGLYLNGKPLILRGIGVHEEDIEVGKCSDEIDIRRRFEYLRDLGANIARASHYPHHELVGLIADELGILLWEEIPVYWAIAFDNPPTYENARNQLVELIRRDANRASVILWGVGNENADTDERLTFMRGLADTARSEDPSRLITAACLINRTNFCIEDRLAEHLDVIGLNEYFGWYEPGFEGLEQLLTNSTPDRPVVISETGADAVAGLNGSDTQLFTEEYQARVLTRQAEIASKFGYVAGMFVWLLYDFRTDRRQTKHQRGWNLKGVVAGDKITKKLGFEALTRAYQLYFPDPK